MIGLHSRSWLALLGVALYGGPVLAGLAGHGWSVLPVLAALFLLYVAATRKPDLRTGAGRAGLVVMAITQGVLVAGAWGAGLLLAKLIGAVVLPLWAPLAITAVAAVLGAWAMRDAAEMDVMLDSALARLAEFETGPANADPDAPASAWPDPAPATEQAVARALAALRDLDGIAPVEIDLILRKLHVEAGTMAFDPLYDAAGQAAPENEPVVDYGLLRFAALPEVFDQLVARGEAGLAPTLLLNAPDRQVRAEARARVAQMVDASLHHTHLPDPGWLDELAGEYPDEGYDALVAGCQPGEAATADA